MIKRLVAVAIISLMVAGCERPESVKEIGFNKQVGLTTLEDGTKCAVLMTGMYGGISCNWK